MAPGVSDRIVRLTAEDVEQLMRAVALIITKLSENPNYGRFNTPSVNYAASGYGGGGGRGRGAGGPGDTAVRLICVEPFHRQQAAICAHALCQVYSPCLGVTQGQVGLLR